MNLFETDTQQNMQNSNRTKAIHANNSRQAKHFFWIWSSTRPTVQPRCRYNFVMFHLSQTLTKHIMYRMATSRPSSPRSY